MILRWLDFMFLVIPYLAIFLAHVLRFVSSLYGYKEIEFTFYYQMFGSILPYFFIFVAYSLFFFNLELVTGEKEAPEAPPEL